MPTTKDKAEVFRGAAFARITYFDTIEVEDGMRLQPIFGPQARP